jgi:hypothetical protein
LDEAGSGKTRKKKEGNQKSSIDNETIDGAEKMSEQVRILTMMVRGAYDLQALRMQTGLRLCANFRAKLMKLNINFILDADGVWAASEGELSDDAIQIVDNLKESYKRLTDGIARNRLLPKQEGFVGDELISTHAELTLVDQYMRLESQEVIAFRQMTGVLETIPIYAQYLKHQKGVGPAMAGAIISTLDPHKARYVSSFWKYAGLDLGPDGRGRSRRAEHLIDREYTDKNGNIATRKSVTYNPWLKTKLFVLAGSFLRSGSPWREQYDNRKHRVQSDPDRIKISVSEWKKCFATGDHTPHMWTPGRIDMDAKRYMLKMFLADLWATWRKLEGLEVTPTYHEAKLGHIHRAA